MGQLADVQWPRPLERAVLGAYCRAYDGPRGVRGARPVGELTILRADCATAPTAGRRRHVGFPADGRLESPGVVTADSLYLVKGRPYRVDAEFVGIGTRPGATWGGGCVVACSSRRLLPSPHARRGKLVCVRSMPGDYFPVDPIGLDLACPNSFVRNRRVALDDETESFGRITVVMVAAMVVGRITVTHFDARDVPWHRTRSKRRSELEQRTRYVPPWLHRRGVSSSRRGFARFVALEGPIKDGASPRRGRRMSFDPTRRSKSRPWRRDTSPAASRQSLEEVEWRSSSTDAVEASAPERGRARRRRPGGGEGEADSQKKAACARSSRCGSRRRGRGGPGGSEPTTSAGLAKRQIVAEGGAPSASRH
ncbi:MAG: phosphatidylserine decarboxylase [Myxococcales bacterium]|nr:phosphatidylserine decarboxylase [Myxococcales bacterium]